MVLDFSSSNSANVWENPLGTDGFEFVEFTSKNPAALGDLFERLGFTAVATHRSKDVTLYRQGDINLILNAEPHSQAERFADVHGPSINAIAFRVRDAAHAMRALSQGGATPVASSAGPMELHLPAIEGIGGSLIYLVDRYGDHSIYDVDFKPIDGVEQHPYGVGLIAIDHLTHNVTRGNMDVWSQFYEELFNFRELRYYDIDGKLTGLHSRALTSPCGKIRIPINESKDTQSQIEEFLHLYNGEGIQHIALSTATIYDTVAALRANGVAFLHTPDTYYDAIDERVPGHREDVEQLRAQRILIDGAPTQGEGLLLQIFSDTVIGPIFFELIQRKGNSGFGEGNFKALFEAVELEQIRRGILPEGTTSTNV